MSHFLDASDKFVVIFFYVFVLFPLSAYLYVDIVDTRWQSMKYQRRLACSFVTMYIVTTTVVVFYATWQGLSGDFKECGAAILASLLSMYGIWKIARLLVATSWLFWAERRYVHHLTLNDRSTHFALKDTDDEVQHARLGSRVSKESVNVCSFRGRKVYSLEGRLSSNLIDDDYAAGNSARVSWVIGYFTGRYFIPEGDQAGFIYRVGLRMLASHKPHVLLWARTLLVKELEGMANIPSIGLVNPFLIDGESIQMAIAQKVNLAGTSIPISPDFINLLMRRRDFRMKSGWDERLGERNSKDWVIMLSGTSDAECSQALSELPADLQGFLSGHRLGILLQALIVTMSAGMAQSFVRGVEIITDKIEYRRCLERTVWVLMKRNPWSVAEEDDGELVAIIDKLEQVQVSPVSFGELATVVEAGLRGVGCDPCDLEIQGKDKQRVGYVEWIILLLAMAGNLRWSEKLEWNSMGVAKVISSKVKKLQAKLDGTKTGKQTRGEKISSSQLERTLSDMDEIANVFSRFGDLGAFETQYRCASHHLKGYVKAIVSPIDPTCPGREVLMVIIRCLLQITICGSSLRLETGMHKYLDAHLLRKMNLPRRA